MTFNDYKSDFKKQQKLIYKTDSDTENKFMVTKGEKVEGDIN